MTAIPTLKRMIHVGCRELGLDHDTRRGLQLLETGKESMAEMTEAELRKVISALQKRGFKPYGSAWFTSRKGGKPGKGHPSAPRGDLRFVHVLWSLLGKAGVLDKPGRAGLNAFIRTRFGAHWQSVPIDVDALRDPKQISDVTRALKDMCQRNGVHVR